MNVRVLHVIDHLGLGGGQVSLKSIVENINSREIECFVCALRPKKETIPINAEIITLKYGKYDPRTILAIAGLCKKYNIDILHAHLSKSIISCLLASFICKKPVIVHERGAIFRKGVFFSVYRFLLRLLHRRAAAIIANSEATALELTARASVGRHRIKVIRNPVDFRAFDAEKVSRRQSRENLRISDEDFVVGFAGRLHFVKGVDLLIRAMALLLEQSPRYLLVLAGDGAERKSLEDLTIQLGIAGRVRFLGMRDNVPEVMAAFDIGVVPSRQEPFGRVAVEFMRIRVPIVSSGAGGLAELVHDGETGIVTRENTPEEIAAAIRCLADDKELRQQLIDNAYRFCERFNVDEHAKKIEKIYREIMNTKLR